MLNPERVYKLLKQQGISLFAGVPDSLLKSFCAYVSDHTTDEQHIITANEGNAIALAAGHYLGSGEPALVYMQNSGIGNAVNPLTSLTDSDVYSIPMLLMIGWRGEPGVKDEPQHLKQGRIMTQLLDVLEIPCYKVSAESNDIDQIISKAITQMNQLKAPVVLLISKGTFETYKLKEETITNYPMGRETAIKGVVDLLTNDDLIVSTTGMASRELYEVRELMNQGHCNDFLTVGAMGHTGSIALGLAKSQKNRTIYCVDGDGSVLMHMGALGIIGKSGVKNLIHIVINNGAHDSVGGQSTVGFDIDLTKIASACGYSFVNSVDNLSDLTSAIKQANSTDGAAFIEVKVNKGARNNLGRPKSTPIENKIALMSQLNIGAAIE
jgi:phosphonopyruvate decarboxylase